MEVSRFIIVLFCLSPPKRSYKTIERHSKGPTKRINPRTIQYITYEKVFPYRWSYISVEEIFTI